MYKSKVSMRGKLYCDGGARGNPGPAGAAAALYSEDGHLLGTGMQYLGSTTNNIAEYQGLLLGLKLARSRGLRQILICLDSELIVRQLNGSYRVRHRALRALWEKAQQELQMFQSWEVVHIAREQNVVADGLVNQVLDQHETNTSL